MALAHKLNEVCETTTVGRRRVFWSTQACGSYDDCGTECGSYGMVLNRSDVCGDIDCDNTNATYCLPLPNEVPRTISNASWVSGLLVNMILMDGAQPESECGFAPGTRGGHWSSSFLDGGASANPFGSNMRSIPAQVSTAATVLAIQVEADVIAERLVSYGVVIDCTAEVSYLGKNRYGVVFKFTGSTGVTQQVGLTGTRFAGSLVWNTQ